MDTNKHLPAIVMVDSRDWVAPDFDPDKILSAKISGIPEEIRLPRLGWMT